MKTVILVVISIFGHCVAMNYVVPEYANPLYNEVRELTQNDADEFLSRLFVRDTERGEPSHAGMAMDSSGRPQMGKIDSNCDDAKTKLEVDWDGSPVNYTCYDPKNRLAVNPLVPPSLECDNVPANYLPNHKCMDEKITYNSPYPTHADHRPVWPQYGEYQFVPPQRWSHNIEHGAIVMLYHPCAHPILVAQLRAIVTRCIFKHVITPTNMIPIDRPLVLVVWGCRLRMNTVNEQVVEEFIKSHALKGPEGTYPKEGQYILTLVKPAEVPSGSTREDGVICPKPHVSRKMFA